MTTTVLLVGSWTLIPLLSVMLSDNQDPRYAVAAYPGIAVLTAAAVTFVRVAIVRWGLAVIIVGYSVIMMSSFSFANFAIPGVPSVWVVNTPKEVAYIKPNGFGGAPVGTDFALTVLQTLEHNAPNHGRTVTPVPVAVLELNGDVNGNNMPYYNSIAGTNFTFTVLPPMSASQAQSLGSTLLQYKFVLFRHLVPESEDVSLGRVAQLNDQAASRYVTAKTLHGFRLVASIDGGADVGQGPRLYVYERAST